MSLALQLRNGWGAWRGPMQWMAALLKRGTDGTLLHEMQGHLVSQCLPLSCPCPAAINACANCGDATPTQFHVTFTDVVPCPGCTACADAASGVTLAGCVINGTYLLTHNGSCAWTAAASLVPCSGRLYFATDCTGDFNAFGVAIQLVRITAGQFLLQVSDDSQRILLFNATVSAPLCCAAFSTANQNANCGCGSSGGAVVINVGVGGMATVTPC